jgi:Asp-tRNA(Asn)/Glu-tRNA(Gln) amidotransferase A subunit family amidase
MSALLDAQDPAALWMTVAACESYAAGRALLDEAPELLEQDSRDFIEAGAESLAVDYVDAQYERAQYTRDWQAFFEEHDVLPGNLTGMPATSVPCGYDDRGLPIGLQFMGPRGSDELTLLLADAWERRFADRRRWPAIG